MKLNEVKKKVKSDELRRRKIIKEIMMGINNVELIRLNNVPVIWDLDKDMEIDFHNRHIAVWSNKHYSYIIYIPFYVIDTISHGRRIVKL